MKIKRAFSLDNLPNSTIIELSEYVSNRELSYEELDKFKKGVDNDSKNSR